MRVKMVLLAAVAAPLLLGSAAVSITPAEAQSVSAQDAKQAQKDAAKRLRQARKAAQQAEKRLRQAGKKGDDVEVANAALAAANQELQAAERQFQAALAASRAARQGNAPAEQETAAPEEAVTEQPSQATEQPSEAEERRRQRAERQEQRRREAAEAAEERAKARDEAKAAAEAQAEENAEKAAEQQRIDDEERRKRRAERRRQLREQEAKSGTGQTGAPIEIIKESEAIGTELDDRQTRQVERLRKKLRDQQRQIQDLQELQTDRNEEVVRRTRDGRIIIRQDDQLVIRHSDDNDRFLRNARDVIVEDLPRGRTRTTITRPDGTQIITIKNRRGDIIYRVRRKPNGREFVLIDNRNRDRQPGINFTLQLPRLIVPIPRDQYIVDLERADRRRLRETLIAPPIEPVERVYTLEEVRQSERLRDKVRRIDLDTVTFNTGSAEISASQVQSLAEIGYAMEDVLIDNPEAVFFVEGHTDAVGSEYSNLDLSDRRAESVAIVLAENFDIPPENLITQGYGEEFLKIPTSGPERANRRVTIRPITDLIQAQEG